MEFTLATVVPLVVLGMCGAVVPWGILRLAEDSLAGLVRAAAASAVVLVSIGATLFAVLYGAEGLPIGALAAEPRSAAQHFIVLGLKSALVWGPVLLLTLVGLGQGIERRRGEEMARRDRS